jgi:hypothetical protein
VWLATLRSSRLALHPKPARITLTLIRKPL